MNEQAKLLAQRVARENSDLKQQITLAYRLTLGRDPSSEELEQSTTFVQQRQTSGNQTETESALTALCLVIYNLNEFFYVD